MLKLFLFTYFFMLATIYFNVALQIYCVLLLLEQQTIIILSLNIIMVKNYWEKDSIMKIVRNDHPKITTFPQVNLILQTK